VIPLLTFRGLTNKKKEFVWIRSAFFGQKKEDWRMQKQTPSTWISAYDALPFCLIGHDSSGLCGGGLGAAGLATRENALDFLGHALGQGVRPHIDGLDAGVAHGKLCLLGRTTKQINGSLFLHASL
jgi:hypothetical protein